jgi:hypothetical protein
MLAKSWRKPQSLLWKRVWKPNQAVKLPWRWLNIWQRLWVNYQWPRRKLTQVAFNQVWLSPGSYVPLPLLHPTPRSHVTLVKLKQILQGYSFLTINVWCHKKQCRPDTYNTSVFFSGNNDLKALKCVMPELWNPPLLYCTFTCIYVTYL